MIGEEALQTGHGGMSEYEMTKYGIFFCWPVNLIDKISQHN